MVTEPKPPETSQPDSLSQMLDLESSPLRAWGPQELGAVLRHQLSTPVQFEVGALDPALASKLAMVASGQNLLLKSFGDLLHHPNPPLELLVMVKDYAKACRSHPDSPLPQEITNVIYYACIVIARRACGYRITSLNDADLRRGVEATLAKPWLDEATRSALTAGLAALEGFQNVGVDDDT